MRADTAALLAAAYIAAMFVLHRMRVYRRRATGLSLELLRRFDYRAVWDELLPGLPEPAGASAPGAEAPAAPRFYAVSPWELPEPPCHKAERDALLRGVVPPQADARQPEVAWLFVHFAIRAVFAGDLEAAESLAERLEEEPGSRLLATIDLARAERAASVRDQAGARQAALSALARAEASLRRQPSAGMTYLAAHVQLAWLTHELNLEVSVAGAAYRLKKGLEDFGDLPCLHLALAQARALLGRHGESLDELGRALYYSHGDAFYVRAIREDAFVFRARPALAAQCRPAGGAGSELPPPGAGG